MPNFSITSYQWIGGFIGSKPVMPAAPPNSGMTYVTGESVPTVTFELHVDVSYGMGPYDGLRIRRWCPSGAIEQSDFQPPDHTVTCTLDGDSLGTWPFIGSVFRLYALTGQSEVLLCTSNISWGWECPGCAVDPTSPGGGCPSGDVSFGSPDQGGNSTLSYSFAGGSGRQAMGSRVVFNTFSNSWGFMALPGNLSLVNLGQTAESTPRDCWHAAVPAADGTSRLYCNDASTGEFMPCGPYGTSFASTGSGWAETIGDSAVHYDVYGVLDKVVRGQSVHTYTHDPGGAWVDIEANTAPPTKFRYALQSGVVQSVHQYAQLSGSGWTEARRLDVSQSGGRISQLTSYPGGRTTSFSYGGDGSLTSYQDCSGRSWHLQYEGA